MAFLTPREVATLAGCPPQMVYTYIKKGALTHRRVGEGDRLAIDRQTGIQWAARIREQRQERQEAREAKVQAQLRGL